ncbi:MAG: TonB-dependent receptor [Rhizorhabdus sp.]|uniref:TonB-dependent receptor n=1 Tax=Rhizorhabdus sp. TaxID=1968843 RepID=UPI001B551394|nr:TonB-dependent receptor [Rhizorhabdus sp.]MBP8233357.1 TonB-dependent receptor [Rhizorhabdus sp.]
MSSNLGRSLITTLFSASALVTGAPVFAGQTEGAASVSEAAEIGDIVVTARRREESLQKVPVSITAFTAADLQARQVDNVSQIAQSTPNLVFNSSAPISGSNTAASIYIRGIGQTDFTLVTDPGVGLYLDGVYIARSVGGVLDLVDVQRVEVLRGPQGTLFGKNTIGGAINITSQPPKDQFGSSVELRTGSRNRIDGKAVVDLPVNDTLALRVSAATLNQDGYVKNVGGPKLGNTKALLGRIALRWTPTDALTVDLAADGTRRREQAQAQKLLDFNPNAGAPTFGPYNGVIAPALGLPQFDGRFTSGGPYQTFQGRNPNAISDLDLWGVGGTIAYDMGGVTLKSITAFRKFDSQFGRDTDNSPFTIVETYDDISQQQFSQEVQLYGSLIDDRLDWLVGGYYFTEKGDNLNNVYTSVILIKSGGAVKNDSLASFAHLTFKATDKLRLTAGARYTDETKRFTPDQQVIFYDYTQSLFGGAGFTDGQRILPKVQSKRKFNDFSMLLGADYQWTDRLMTYVSFSQGFKSGGFNQRVFPPRAVPGSFEPETADVYEAGLKTSNAAGTVRFDLAGFYTRYRDIQVRVLDVIAPGTGNAAAGRVYGAEAELTLRPVKPLTLQFSAGYLDTGYTKFAADFDPSQGIDKGDSFVNSPKWSLAGSASYVVPLGEVGDLTLRGDWSYRSKTYSDAANSENIAQSGYHLFNATLLYDTSDKLWQVAAGIRNITDKRYLLTGNNEFGGFGYVEGVFARPREWSLSVRRSF